MGFLSKLGAVAGKRLPMLNKYVPPPAETSAERVLKEISPEDYDRYMTNDMPEPAPVSDTNYPKYKPFILPVKYGNVDDMQKDLQVQQAKEYEQFLKEQEELRKADIDDAIIRRHQPKPVFPPPGY